MTLLLVVTVLKVLACVALLLWVALVGVGVVDFARHGFDEEGRRHVR